jgi:methyl-accepting chemotaxis protein
MEGEMVKEYITSVYSDDDVIVQKKAYYLFIFCLLIAGGVLVLFIFGLLLTDRGLIQQIITTFPTITFALICLFIIAKKKYQIAGHLVVLACTAGILYHIVAESTDEVFFYSINFIPGIIFLSLMFSNRLLAAVLLILFLIFYGLTYFVFQSICPGLTLLSLVNIVIALILTYIGANLLVNTLNRALGIAQDESAKNRNLYMSTAKLLEKVRDQVVTLSRSSEEMSKTTETFSENAQNQAAFVEEVTSTVEEVSSVVENVSRNVVEQYESINRLVSAMSELSEIIDNMKRSNEDAIRATGAISDKVKMGEESLGGMSNSMRTITESSDEMTGIVRIINDISDRINLLSLNAAIEAARAGEAGRGFAVVADEISKLADQTASSIQEIDRLIRANNEEIARGMDGVNRSVAVMRSIIEGMETVNGVINTSSENMRLQVAKNTEVNNEADMTRIRSDEIKVAGEELRNVMEEITKSISSMNELIQANASGAEQMASSSNIVKEVALSLKQEVELFEG